MNSSGAIPGPVQETLQRMETYWKSQDADLAAAFRVILRNPELEQVATSAIAQHLLTRRMRERVEGVKLAHPELSIRSVFRHVATFTGYGPSWVLRLYYPRRASAGVQERTPETQPEG